VDHRIGRIWRVEFDLFGIVMSRGDHRSEHIWGGGCNKCVYDHMIDIEGIEECLFLDEELRLLFLSSIRVIA